MTMGKSNKDVVVGSTSNKEEIIDLLCASYPQYVAKTHERESNHNEVDKKTRKILNITSDLHASERQAINHRIQGVHQGLDYAHIEIPVPPARPIFEFPFLDYTKREQRIRELTQAYWDGLLTATEYKNAMSEVTEAVHRDALNNNEEIMVKNSDDLARYLKENKVEVIGYDTETTQGLFQTTPTGNRKSSNFMDVVNWVVMDEGNATTDIVKRQVEEETEGLKGHKMVVGIASQGMSLHTRLREQGRENLFAKPQDNATDETEKEFTEALAPHIERLKAIFGKYEIKLVIVDIEGQLTEESLYLTGYVGILTRGISQIKTERLQEDFVIDVIELLTGRNFKNEKEGKLLYAGVENAEDESKEYVQMSNQFYRNSGKTIYNNKLYLIVFTLNQYLAMDKKEQIVGGRHISCFMELVRDEDEHVVYIKNITEIDMTDPTRKKHFAEGLLKGTKPKYDGSKKNKRVRGWKSENLESLFGSKKKRK